MSKNGDEVDYVEPYWQESQEEGLEKTLQLKLKAF